MRVEMSTEVNASRERVWSVMTDVERWPQWTESVSSIERLDEGSFGLGSRVRIRQPKLPVADWRVTDLEPGHFFTWTNKSPGLTSVASHRVEPIDDGRCSVTLWIDQSGLLSPLVAFLTGRMTRRYVRLELDGLKQRCEQS